MKKIFSLLTILAILAICNTTTDLKSEEFNPELLPSMIGASNSGTLFYMTFHPAFEEGLGMGNGMRIYISSKYATNVTLEIEGINKSIVKTTIPNETIEFFLKREEASMYFKVYEAPKPEKVWKGRAIKITSDDPIICYAVARLHATTDSYMALPVSSLGNEYQVASSPNAFFEWGYEISSFTSIVGAYDNTQVTFKMGGCETCYALKNDSTYLHNGESITRTLDEGDVWLIPGIDNFSDLTGSTVNANKPVAVFSGNQCGQIPTHARPCDYMIEQEHPIDTWGRTYLVTPILGRKNYSIFKIFASEPNTEVSIDGVPSYTIQTSGGVKDTGFIEIRAGILDDKDTIVKPIIISGNKPINVIQFNTSYKDDNINPNINTTEPFQMQVIPVEQFRKDITFNTAGIINQYGFKANIINIVFKATTDGSIPDDLMFAEFKDGNFAWVPLSSLTSEQELSFSKLETDGRHYYMKTIKLPNDGVYRIKSDDPFAAYAYGYDYYESYGYPLTGCVKDLTTDDELSPVAIWNIDEYGTVTGSAIDAVQENVTASGLSVITMISALSENFKFIPEQFITGTLDSVKFGIAVINPAYTAKAVIAVSDRRGNDTVFVITYNPPPLPDITGSNLSFALLKSSQEAELEFKLENTIEIETLEIKSIILENSDPKFTIIDNLTESKVIQVGEIHTFKVKFRADDLYSKDIDLIEGIFKNRVGYELTNGKQYFLREMEAAVENPRIDMNDVKFAQNPFDEDFESKYITIENPGENFLEIYDFEYSDDSHFIYSLPEASTEKPFVINSKAERKIRVQFKPDSPGTYFDTLKVKSDAYIIKEKSHLSAIALPTSVKDDGRIKAEISIRYENNSFIFNSGTDYQLNSVDVYDLSGRLIHTANSNTTLNNYSLRVVGLSSGVYVVKMNINNSIVSKKVII